MKILGTEFQTVGRANSKSLRMEHTQYVQRKENQQLEHSEQGEELGDGGRGRQELDRRGLAGSDNNMCEFIWLQQEATGHILARGV